MNIIHKTEWAIKIGNRISNAMQVIGWDYEIGSVEGSFDFGDQKENQQYIDRFKSGYDLVNVSIFVRCSWNGFEGRDDLGMCHVTLNNLEKDIEQLVMDHGMQQNARNDLRRDILEKFSLLKPLINEQLDLEYGVSND